MNAVIRNGFLYTCHHVGLMGTNGVDATNDASGASVDRSAIQWLQFQLDPAGAGLSYRRHGRVFDAAPTNPWYYYFPSIGVNCASEVVLGFSGSATNQYIGAFFAWRPIACAVEDPPFQFHQGTAHWPGSRWGDYSATFSDPADGEAVWTVQQYAITGNEGDAWATWIARIKRKQ